ncbi:hypothetical protein ACFT54_10275 [Streptomyces cinereoruber]|uniref:hypothetical protein n=1 Tax=Streptomyces cinereoruber TaxID=67260 RepID=UPI0036364769
MLDGIIGGVVAALLTLLGAWLTTREAKKGRVAASEEKASAVLLGLLKGLREDPQCLQGIRERRDFEENYLATVFAFRDPKVRDRLQRSLDAILTSRLVAYEPELREEYPALDRVVARDVRECLIARIDGKRLPKPTEEWTYATAHAVAYLRKQAASMEAAERQADEDRENAYWGPGGIL